MVRTHSLSNNTQIDLGKVLTSVGLASSVLDTTYVSIMRISHLWMSIGYRYFTMFLVAMPFGSIYHARTFMHT